MDKKDIPQIDWKQTDALISLALSEDLDTVGDATTNSVIPENLQAKAVFLTKGIVSVPGSPSQNACSKPLTRNSNGRHWSAKANSVPKAQSWRKSEAMRAHC